jgi:hypothetical protein
MAQDPRQQYAQMLSAMPPNALERIKKEMRRRFMLFGLGTSITIVGMFLTPNPVWVPTLVKLAGGAVALIGMLGLSRGAGCMAYVAGFFWLSAVSCGVARGYEATLYVLGGTAAAFALASLLIPKPKAQNPLADLAKMMQQPGGPGGPGGFPGGFPGFGQPPQGPPENALGTQRPARERVIDIDAQEKSAKPEKAAKSTKPERDHDKINLDFDSDKKRK